MDTESMINKHMKAVEADAKKLTGKDVVAEREQDLLKKKDRTIRELFEQSRVQTRSRGR